MSNGVPEILMDRSPSKGAQVSLAAEAAGMTMQGDEVVAALLGLLSHPRPIAREGALLGLSYHLGHDGVRLAIANTANRDAVAEVRNVAAEILGGWAEET